jgi:predicted transcriptional regulator of viral defense system
MRSHRHLAGLAEAQHGVVSFRQLRELGFSKGHISRAFEAGRLQRIHRGVYAIGHGRLSDHGICHAAVLACGAGAVLSHHSAAWLWGFLPRCPREAAVTTPSRGHRRRRIRVHRAAALAERDCTTHEGIPATSAARTLLDLGAVGTTRELTSAVDRARRLGRLDFGALDPLIARHRSTTPAKRLEQVLTLYRKPVFDRARSELLFLDALEQEGESSPVLNCWVGKWEVDAFWAAERFAVEVDGWESHGSRQAFEDDRLRLEEMKLEGIDCIRVSARRIETHPKQVAQRISTFLARRRNGM